MTARRVRSAGRRLGIAAWPELFAVLRTPATRTAPPPHAFARFGAASWIAPPARVVGAEHIAIGSEVVVMEGAEMLAVAAGSMDTPLLVISDGARLARFATIWATVGVEIGRRVSTSDGVAIIDCWRPPGAPAGDVPEPTPERVIIEDGAYLGAGCVIGPGVVVGRNAYVGEGAVVTADVPAHSMVSGNPARSVRRWTPARGWQATG